MGKQIVRQFVYGLVGVSPLDDQLASLVLPWVDTEAMSLFLAHTAARFRHPHSLMLLGGAGWHTAQKLRVPPTRHLLWLPPHSPELNPAEHHWEHLRENYISNRVFSSRQEMIKQLCSGLGDRHRQAALLRSMINFD